MKVIQLKSENFRGIKVADVTPDPSDPIVRVSGNNGAGKSSLIDSIWGALDAAAIKREGTETPIRTGKEKASAQVDLGDLVVTRIWTKKTSTLKVENKEGQIFKSPQAVLDGLMGKISFDPLAFIRLEAKQQRAMLLEMLGLGQKLDGIQAEIKRIFEDRTIINREIKRLEALQPTGVDMDGPVDAVSISDFMTEIEGLREVLRKNGNKRQELGALRLAYDQKEARLLEIEREIQGLIGEAETLKKDMENMADIGARLREEVDALVDPDIQAAQKKVGVIDQENKIRAARKAALENSRALDSKRKQADQMTLEISSLEESKAALILKERLPLEGLGFSEDGVTYQGIPLTQISQAEKIRVGVAMAMALNPSIRVIRIADGSLLDAKNLQIIRDLAKEKDFQCWVETVDETGKVGIFVEEGEIKEGKR